MKNFLECAGDKNPCSTPSAMSGKVEDINLSLEDLLSHMNCKSERI